MIPLTLVVKPNSDSTLTLAQLFAIILNMSKETNNSEQDRDYLANHDSMTGLINRRGLNIELGRLLEQTPGKFSLAAVDVDRLKEVNDNEGHAAGDRLINKAAAILSGSLRTKEADVHNEHRDNPNPELDIVTAARIGGDEFILLLPGVTDQETLDKIIDRIKENLLEVGISASIAGQPHKPGESGDDLIDAADKLMMARKEGSKKEAFESLPRRKRVAAKFGGKLLKYAGVNPPRQ